MKLANFLKLLASIAICELAGIVGSIFTVSAIPTWYATLAKPTVNPPSWVFAPVWITLYALMGISLFLIWKQYSLIRSNGGIATREKWAMILFFVQLVLNALWSVLFFGLHSIGGALIDIVLLWLAILATIVSFYRISRPAAFLLVPYILWVTFAVYLNYSIWVIN